MARHDTLSPPEPAITINGHELTEAQALTVRVALEVFSMTLADEQIDRNYRARLDEIRVLIFQGG